jgi:hypothetical protein
VAQDDVFAAFANILPEVGGGHQIAGAGKR